ncbi:MAG TPA: type VI secretion protein IcmF/TssM N-terminal domain-containing protein [Pyrinomonadaceae bacterium]|nr:type VI secretion protein IcmF/TssM N-terminal domain-containing protein [Pyrinomonadaceae bacterium]
MSTFTVILILIAIFLLLVGTAIFLYLVIRRSRKIAFAPEPTAQAKPDDKETSGVEFLQHASDVELRTSFRRALRLLKTCVTGRDYRYRAPWYLLAGESKSGKTSLLESNGLNESVKELIDKSGRRLNWYFFDDGVVMDVAGDFVLRKDGTANHRGWNTIMRLLQKHRPQRPLDGFVLTIPCSDLMCDGELPHQRRFELEQKATSLYKKLWQAQRILGMRLPIYVLVTKCDEITGFSSLCKQLPDKLHTQMFGWSNPSMIETAYRPELVDLAFESIHKHLSWLQFEIYAERDDIEDADDLFLLPPAMQSMRDALSVYLDCLFKQSAYHESYIFRGVYFCGEPGISTAGPLELERMNELPVTLDTLPTTKPAAVPRKPVFLADLFKEKIFSESSLAQPIRRIALSRNRLALTAQILTLLIVLVGGSGLALSYRHLSHEEDELYRFLLEEENDLKKIEAYYADFKRSSKNPATGEDWLARKDAVLESGETKLLQGMANMHDNRFASAFIPTSWFSGINTRLERSVAAAFKYVIFESLRLDMQQRGKTLLSAHPTHRASSAQEDELDLENPAMAEETAGGSASHLDGSFQLSLYVEELGAFRDNLERYNRLIGKDPDSLVNLRQLVNYLDHTPVPDNFDQHNSLYEKAIIMALGRPIDTTRYYKESAHRVSDLVEDFYAASFHQRGVSYVHLNDIAETEALLNRPDYTWLSTYLFDPHSPFHGMTLATGLGELRKALQDLRRQEFMLKESAEYDLPVSAERPQYQHLVRRVLVWDQDALRQAIALHDQYEDFVSTKTYERAEYLDSSVKQAAKTRLKTRMSRLFRQARKYQTLAPATEGSALRNSLITEIRSLQEVQPVLSRVLQVSAPLGIDGELRTALSSQVEYLLRGIYREFLAQRFYVMKHSDFAWWNGGLPVSHVAFDLQSLEDLQAYLVLQRKNIAFLARDLAVPLMTFAAQQNINPTQGSEWNEVLTDLEAYDNKMPGNPIAALETFIAIDMDKVSIDSCASTLKLTSDSSKDYFLRLRNSLRATLYRRCNELARVKAVNDALAALENYREIQEAFNKTLSGGFPFTDLGQRPDFPDLDPWELMKFFRLFDAKEKAAREALIRSADFGAAPQGAEEFLDQVVKVREFFAPFLEKKQGPMLDFSVQFRVNREDELAANQIIDWKFEVGKKKFAYLSDDLNGRWVFGDPVRLTLRWANNSPTVPITGATPTAVKAKDRIAVIEYTDRWSLFTLLLRHGAMLKRAGTPAECDQGYDADPYTLKFTIRTDPDPAGEDQRAELKNSTAEVFMRMSLVAANKQEPILLPCFPRKAPPVPTLPVVFQNTNEQE